MIVLRHHGASLRHGPGGFSVGSQRAPAAPILVACLKGLISAFRPSQPVSRPAPTGSMRSSMTATASALTDPKPGSGSVRMRHAILDGVTTAAVADDNNISPGPRLAWLAARLCCSCQPYRLVSEEDAVARLFALNQERAPQRPSLYRPGKVRGPPRLVRQLLISRRQACATRSSAALPNLAPQPQAAQRPAV